MKLLLLGVSVRWTKPTNPLVDETPETRLIVTPSGWRNLATIFCKSNTGVESSKKQNTIQMYETPSLTCLLFDWMKQQLLGSNHNSNSN